jgi:copper oxidase (laccase) domain-containing protein
MLGAGTMSALIGPTIHPECYEFGDVELMRLEALLGPEVRSRTSQGAPALDLPTAVRVALRGAGVDAVASVGGCTACDPDLFSWRGRRDAQRQAMVLWR